MSDSVTLPLIDDWEAARRILSESLIIANDYFNYSPKERLTAFADALRAEISLSFAEDNSGLEKKYHAVVELQRIFSDSRVAARTAAQDAYNKMYKERMTKFFSSLPEEISTEISVSLNDGEWEFHLEY